MPGGGVTLRARGHGPVRSQPDARGAELSRHAAPESATPPVRAVGATAATPATVDRRRARALVLLALACAALLIAAPVAIVMSPASPDGADGQADVYTPPDPDGGRSDDGDVTRTDVAPTSAPLPDGAAPPVPEAPALDPAASIGPSAPAAPGGGWTDTGAGSGSAGSGSAGSGSAGSGERRVRLGGGDGRRHLGLPGRRWLRMAAARHQPDPRPAVEPAAVPGRAAPGLAARALAALDPAAGSAARPPAGPGPCRGPGPGPDAFPELPVRGPGPGHRPAPGRGRRRDRRAARQVRRAPARGGAFVEFAA